MKILGVKYTHDAAVALIEDGCLRFSFELEKTGGERHAKMPERSWVDAALASEGLTPADIDQFVCDGWKRDRQRFVPVAGYNEFEDGEADPLARYEYPTYASYSHTTGHLLGSYGLSPFVPHDAVLITWDGGGSARAYLLEPKKRSLKLIGVLVDICASVYSNMGLYFGPYKRPSVIDAPDVPYRTFGPMELAGKLMAYLAQGQVRPELATKVRDALYRLPLGTLAVSDDSIREHTFLRALRGNDDADTVATVQEVLGDELVRRAQAICPKGLPAVLSGGAALNIKWNSALRACGHFSDVFVPPVANDSGSAIGMAYCEHVHRTGRWELDWNVYAGPKIDKETPPGWTHRSRSLSARLVNKPDEPVIVMRGRAEIGPRALGHRSIIASAIRAENKDLLNNIKRREAFRPVAPICLESHVRGIFDPGFPDPFMTFEQQVRPGWRKLIPAVVHIDGSARVQTVNAAQEPFLSAVLEGYHEATGVPVLCNTSANRPGRGFFPSIADAARWAEEVGIKAIATEQGLYERHAP